MAKLSWREMEKRYVGREYRGESPYTGRQITIKVTDVTLGGDVCVRRKGHQNSSTWSQDFFLAFVGKSNNE